MPNTGQLDISLSKCNVMYVSIVSRNVNMFLNGHVLPAVNEVKDLGVIVDSRLTFAAHIDHIVARASIRANFIH